MLLFNKYVFYELLYQQIYHPPFICRLDTLYITCLTLILFVIVVMNEIVSLVPRALYLIDWTAVSDTKLKCTIHARGRLLVPPLCLSAML